jgi:predicted phage terminase large subunit-like protein
LPASVVKSAFASRFSQDWERRRANRPPSEYEQEIAESREACRNLFEFVRQAWHVLEPVAPFIDGKVLHAICDHLTAVHDLEILRLLVNVPPGCMKSLLVSVFFQAWEWGPMGRPDLRTISTSYSGLFAKRDTRKTLNLITSPWYQERWGTGVPNPVVLTREGETSFGNTAQGTRDAVPFVSLTSGRGDRLLIDDPHSTETAESEAERDRTIRIFRESVPDRINNPKTSAIIVIMQRLNRGDVSGEIERLDLPYERFIMPMEFEAERVCRTSIGFTDWRTQSGELLWPERFSAEWLAAQKVVKGPYAIAAQYQQRPTAREGGMFKRHNFKIIDAIPSDVRIHARVRRWDLAASIPKAGSDPDWSAGVKLAAGGGKFYFEHLDHFREEGAATRRAIRTNAGIDGRAVHIVIPQDPGQAGKDQAQSIIAENAGWVITAERETGAKDVRAEPLAAQSEAGNVYLIRGPWNERFIDELCGFPGAPHDDIVDAASGAFNKIAGMTPMVVTDEMLARAKALGPRRRY